VHAGQAFEPRTGAVVPPLHFSSTYAQDGIGGLRDGYEYGRGGNPTSDALQEQLAALERGTHAYSFSSGLAAEDSLIRALMRPGDHIVLGNDAYGGTYRLISRVLGEWGIGNTPWTCRISTPFRPRLPPTRPASSGWRRRPTR
jgi:cystathionine gamma-synthase